MSQRWADPFQAARGDSLGLSMLQNRCSPYRAISNATSQPCWMALPRLDSPARRPHHGHEHRRAANYRHSAVASSMHRATARGFLPQGLSNTCPQAGAMRSPVPSRGQVSNKPKQQPPLADGRSKVLILRSGRSSAGGACRHRARAVRLQLDQPNRCCRPQAARQISPKLPDAQPRLLAFRIHERALGDLRQPASCCRSAPPHGRQFKATS